MSSKYILLFVYLIFNAVCYADTYSNNQVIGSRSGNKIVARFFNQLPDGKKGPWVVEVIKDSDPEKILIRGANLVPDKSGLLGGETGFYGLSQPANFETPTGYVKKTFPDGAIYYEAQISPKNNDKEVGQRDGNKLVARMFDSFPENLKGPWLVEIIKDSDPEQFLVRGANLEGVKGTFLGGETEHYGLSQPRTFPGAPTGYTKKIFPDGAIYYSLEIEKQKCQEGPEIREISSINNTSLKAVFHGVNVLGIDYEIRDLTGQVQASGSFKPQNNSPIIRYDNLDDGQYTLKFNANTCSGESIKSFVIGTKLPRCQEGPELRDITKITASSLNFLFHGINVSSLKYEIHDTSNSIVSSGNLNPKSSNVSLSYSDLKDGEYKLKIRGMNCIGESEKNFSVNLNPNVTACKRGPTIGSIINVSPTGLDCQFDGEGVTKLRYTVSQNGSNIVSYEFAPTKNTFPVNFSKLDNGTYELKLSAVNCSGDDSKSFTVTSSKDGGVDPEIEIGTALNGLILVNDPLAAKEEKKGNYVIHFVESRPDDHLNPKITENNGNLFLSDTGSSLNSVTYILNGWSDYENSGVLQNEPVKPYRLYHLTKQSVNVGTITDSWRAASWVKPEERAIEKRSELFFYIVPSGEAWNPVGESTNPIGRPSGFSHIPSFKLKNRYYGFEYDFVDESSRKDDLDITFNNKKRHHLVYSPEIHSFSDSLPGKPNFENFTKEQCQAFGDSLGYNFILAFDFETDRAGTSKPGYATCMGYVIERLAARGVTAYDWMAGSNFKDFTFNGVKLGAHHNWGMWGKDIVPHAQAYENLNKIQKPFNPNSIVQIGFGYDTYDNNWTNGDGVNGQNKSAQATYLKSLDTSELWSRVWSDKQLLYFVWPFNEFVNTFPQNHIVNLSNGAVARRTDNKPLYSPNIWEDNLTLGLITSKYLFYWSPGNASWDPIYTGSYNDAYKKNPSDFTVWTYESGKGPKPERENGYLGKESTAITATIKAAYNFSQVQDAMDGTRTAPKFSFQRSKKDGSMTPVSTVEAINDGSWYLKSFTSVQPFLIICEKNGSAVALYQDVWARPGGSSLFEFEYKGKKRSGRTEGNRLFISRIEN